MSGQGIARRVCKSGLCESVSLVWVLMWFCLACVVARGSCVARATPMPSKYTFPSLPNTCTIEALSHLKVCEQERLRERAVLSKLLSRFGEHHSFFSHQPRCAAYFLLLFAPAWITPAYCLVYITYFFVSVCKCVTCIYNVLSLPVYYDTTVACDTLALGVYRLFLTRYRLCSGSGSMLSQLYTHYLVAPLVKSTAFCELSVLIMFRVFLSPRGLQTKCNKKYRPMLTGSLASVGQLLLDGVLMHIASIFFFKLMSGERVMLCNFSIWRALGLLYVMENGINIT